MSLAPKKLGIYYGWPSAVNGSGGDVNLAVAVFKEYDIIVFGAGLQDSSHGDHANTAAIIAHADMGNTEVYGYIDAAADLCDNEIEIDDWKAMGVDGIFMDQFGYDFGVKRCMQNHHLDYIHGEGLKAFVNAWNIDDVFSPAVEATYNPRGKASSIAATDWYLAESFVIENGAYQASANWKPKAEKMVTYKTSHGTNMASVTTWDASAYDQSKWDKSYFAAALYEFGAAGFGEESFSSVSASLPWRPRKDIYGTQFTGPVTEAGGVLTRPTNVGIKVDNNVDQVDTIIS